MPVDRVKVYVHVWASKCRFMKLMKEDEHLLGTSKENDCDIGPKIAKVSGITSMAMGGFDTLSLAISLFDPKNPLVQFNKKLHENDLYNKFQFSVSMVAVFTGGFAKGMENPVCFVAGTMVLTIAGLRAIETIKAGEKVIATNPDTHQTEEKTVVETYINKTECIVHLHIKNEVINTTKNHPFYVKGRGFVEACELAKGDEVVNVSGGSYPVERIEFEEKLETVYNFQVEDYHTYYVGENGVLVHNDCKYKISDNGDIEVTDWKDYPEGQPKPQGPLKLVDGDDYVKVRKEANNANRNIHKSNPSLKGKDIHEVKPVKWGGSPTDLSNKIPLPRSEHAKLTGWWKTFQSMIEKTE